MRNVEHFIAGNAVSGGSRVSDIFDPNNGVVQAQVGLGTKADLDRAVEAAKAAQPGWAAVNPQRRSRVMFRFKERSEEYTSELQSLMRISYAVFCLKKNINKTKNTSANHANAHHILSQQSKTYNKQ